MRAPGCSRSSIRASKCERVFLFFFYEIFYDLKFEVFSRYFLVEEMGIAVNAIVNSGD